MKTSILDMFLNQRILVCMSCMCLDDLISVADSLSATDADSFTDEGSESINLSLSDLENASHSLSPAFQQQIQPSLPPLSPALTSDLGCPHSSVVERCSVNASHTSYFRLSSNGFSHHCHPLSPILNKRGGVTP